MINQSKIEVSYILELLDCEMMGILSEKRDCDGKLIKCLNDFKANIISRIQMDSNDNVIIDEGILETPISTSNNTGAFVVKNQIKKKK